MDYSSEFCEIPMTRTTIDQAIEAAEHPIVLETSAQLENASATWKDSEILGIDTEFVRERTYRAALGLVQVSDGKTAWLLDPLALPSLQALADLLENPGIMKILHSGSEDLEVLLHSVGTLPSPLADSQVACAMLGQPLQMGYHAAVNWLFDIDVDKEQTRSNWCRRPLNSKQLHYAAMDVTLLPSMILKLRSQLEAKNRWEWLLEDVARMQQTARTDVDPREAYLRVSGAGRLDGRGLKVLRRLAAWREETAIQKNLARGFVINDAGLMGLAQAKPETKAEIAEVEGLHPRALERYRKVLLQVIRDGLHDETEIKMPALLNNPQKKLLKDMRARVTRRAAELEVDPALLASRRELEKLIRAAAGEEELPERFLGWRKQAITDDLMAIIR
jgi:ribonuclease D